MPFKKILIVSVLVFSVNCLMSQECYESTVVSPSPFMGNNGEIFKLSDGTFWEIQYEYEYLYEYYPTVIICPSKGKLSIKDKMLNVKNIGRGKPVNSASDPVESITDDVIESRIDGDFDEWKGETIVKLTNGQIWQQSEYYYHFHYAFMPKVIIFRSNNGYKMSVEGIEKSVGVIKLK